MNDKAWASILILSAVALSFGIFLHAWMQPAPIYDGIIFESLVVQGHSWAAGNANITLTVWNNRAKSMSVAKVLVDDVAASNVTYGPAFSGPAHTLSEGASGTITITQQFSSGFNYKFEVISATGDWDIYAATAP